MSIMWANDVSLKSIVNWIVKREILLKYIFQEFRVIADNYCNYDKIVSNIIASGKTDK